MMHYFVFKRHGARWDSLRLLSGPFEHIDAAKQSFAHLPIAQQHQIFIVQEIERNPQLTNKASGPDNVVTDAYPKIRSVKQ